MTPTNTRSLLNAVLKDFIPTRAVSKSKAHSAFVVFYHAIQFSPTITITISTPEQDYLER